MSIVDSQAPLDSVMNVRSVFCGISTGFRKDLELSGANKYGHMDLTISAVMFLPHTCATLPDQLIAMLDASRLFETWRVNHDTQLRF